VKCVLSVSALSLTRISVCIGIRERHYMSSVTAGYAYVCCLGAAAIDKRKCLYCTLRLGKFVKTSRNIWLTKKLPQHGGLTVN
jgi:hypothetical protein